MIQTRYVKRKARASFIAEGPLALWILFFLMTFPFLDLATVLLRYTFLVSAVRDGVHAAAHAKTFLINPSPTNLSAVNTAPLAVSQTASAFSEIQVTSVQTRILATNIASKQLTVYTSPLTQAADDASNLYEIEIVVQGAINPLINLNIGILPAIPGLTASVPVTLAAREFCEYPQGLNQ